MQTSEIDMGGDCAEPFQVEISNSMPGGVSYPRSRANGFGVVGMDAWDGREGCRGAGSANGIRTLWPTSRPGRADGGTRAAAQLRNSRDQRDVYERRTSRQVTNALR